MEEIKVFDEDLHLDYISDDHLHYEEDDEDYQYILLYHKGKLVGKVFIYLDSDMKDREYIIINYTIKYLDNLRQKI